MTTYYKLLSYENTGEYSGFNYTNYLPNGLLPGKWLPKIKDIEMCKSGYHVCEKENILNWANDALYVVEIRGEIIKGDNKAVAQQMRFLRKVEGWNERNLRLAAAEIVKKISLPIWKKYYPDDSTLDDIINIVIRYANGQATDNELSAAESAAESAARSAAWSAAESAAEEIVYRKCGL